MKVCDFKKDNGKICKEEADWHMELKDVENEIHLCQQCYFEILSRVRNKVELL